MKDVKEYAVILFLLPDSRVVLQRRTKDAPYAPGLLGTFGGVVADGETIEECLYREISEETSVDLMAHKPSLLADFFVQAGGYVPIDRYFYLYEARIPDLNFEVYEGDGAEAYSLEEARNRPDLNYSARFMFDNVL